MNILQMTKKLQRSAAVVAATASICAASLSVAPHSSAQLAQEPTYAAPASQIVLNMDPDHSKINWTLPSTLHAVHGTFALKGGVLRFDPMSGAAQGEFIALAATGDSGNEGRDKKMHKEILESAKYPDVIFHPTKIEGKVAGQGTSDVQLLGTFLLHGSEHQITVPVHAELSGNQWKGTSKFSIPYVQWGLKSPNTFLLKADPAVQIELELSGTVQEKLRG